MAADDRRSGSARDAPGPHDQDRIVRANLKGIARGIEHVIMTHVRGTIGCGLHGSYRVEQLGLRKRTLGECLVSAHRDPGNFP